MLDRFYREVYIDHFPDPNERETLDSFKRDLDRKASGWFEDNNYHIVIAAEDGKPLAGCVASYMAEPLTGMIEFLVVAPEMRGQRLGYRLLNFMEDLMQKDAANNLCCIVAEINDPSKILQQPDKMNPVQRFDIWKKWGMSHFHGPICNPLYLKNRNRFIISYCSKNL